MTEFLALNAFWHCIGIETLAKGTKGKGRIFRHWFLALNAFWHSEKALVNS